MLSGEPRITEHAYWRALDRLGMTKNAWYTWVKCTYRDWLQVSGKYLQDRGVICDSLDSQHFVCPWTPRASLAICVSTDGTWVKTVMTFAVQEPVVELKAAGGRAA